MRDFDESFENKEVVVTRREFGEIVAREIQEVSRTAMMCGDVKTAMLVTELLVMFGAGVMHELFAKDELEVDTDE